MLTALLLSLIAVAQADSARNRTTPAIPPIGQLVHRRWTIEDGAPSEPRSLAQTADGYLWIGSRTGLTRFDGVRFVPLAVHSGDTIPKGGVRRLHASRDGALWIVWRSGTVSRFAKGRITSYGEQDGLATTYVIAESRAGAIIAGTLKGLSRLTADKWKDVGLDWKYPGRESKAAWFDRNDGLWAQTEDRIVYLHAGSTQFIDPDLRLRSGAQTADFAEAKDGTVWIAELGRSVHTLRRDSSEKLPVTEVLVGSQSMLIDRRGSVWIGSSGDGLRRVVDPARVRGMAIAQFGTEAETYTTKDGLISDEVIAMLEDHEGNIWVATARGLERFREGVFAPVPSTGAVKSSIVFATRDTAAWIMTLNTRDVQRSSKVGSSTFATGFFPFNMTQDSTGAVLTASGNAVIRLEGERFNIIKMKRNDAQRLVDIASDASGTVWLLDEATGLLRVSRDSTIRVAAVEQPGVPHGYLFVDRAGRIWVTQRTRVAQYDHGKLTFFVAAKGETPGDVHTIFEDRAGNIWAGSDEGLSRFESGRFRSLRQTLPARAVLGIIEDESRAWWIATPAGVVRLAPGEIDRAAADSNYALRFRTFDRLDGLPGVISPNYWGPVLARTADGRIWVATDSGVARADVQSMPSEHAPPILIESARIDGRDLALSDTVRINAGSRELEIDYTSTHFARSDRIQFRYRLDDDAPWIDVGTRRRAYYPDVPPGFHRFMVSASHGDGVWSDTVAQWTFRMLPPWYQTLWFRSAVVLLIGGIGAALAVLIQHTRHQRIQVALTREYNATLAERSRIAQDLHDTLLQGFAGVAVQMRAAELALPAHPAIAVETIGRVRRLAQDSLREARERVWEMHDTAMVTGDLPTALETIAHDRTQGTDLVFVVNVAGQRRRLPGALEDAAIRIVREAIVNVVKHANAQRLEIDVTFAPHQLLIEIRDDGQGFATDESVDARRAGHFGLSGMRARAAHAGGHIDIRPGQAGGTIVRAALPLSEQSH